MKLTIRNKLIAGFGVIVALMLLSTGIVSLRLSANAASQERIKSVRYPASMSAADIRSSIGGAAAALRGYVLFGSDPAEAAKFRQDRADNWSAADAAIARLQVISHDLTPAEKARIDSLAAEAAEFRSIQDKIEDLAFGHDAESTGQAFDLLKSEAAPRTRKLSASLKELMQDQEQKTGQEVADLAARSHSTQQVEWGVTVFAALAAMGLAFFISLRFDVALGPVVARAKSIASGDLTGDELTVQSNDELGELTGVVNEMQRGLQDMIASVRAASDRLASATDRVSSSTSQAAQSAETQRDRAHQVAIAMQQMSTTVEQVAGNSQTAADAAQRAALAARQGGAVADQALITMRSIAGSTECAASRIAELGKNSEHIGRIIAVIDDIADQTNLLALNAAIEAARAGAQGRGFAVVADEVRKLAERTTKATKEIAEMVRTIQSETKSAVEAMRAGSHDVEVGVGKTTESGAALNQIIQVAEEVGSLIACIATAASQQASATEDVTRNITQISSLAQESASAADQAATSCEDLSTLTHDLRSTVSQFKLISSVNRTFDPRPQEQGETMRSLASAAAAGTRLLAPASRARSVPRRP
jgi:methyl-accepting chemotaxis protein